MKKIIFIMLLFQAAAARAGDVEVYDWQTGQYRDYDVTQRGRNVSVYDWTEGACREYSISGSGRDVYDWQTGRYLDLKPRGPDRFEVYDWQEQKSYDVKVKHHGWQCDHTGQ